jgi:hypothetical protein
MLQSPLATQSPRVLLPRVDTLKVKATALQKTLYRVKADLFSDYLRAELRNPGIQAYSAGQRKS